MPDAARGPRAVLSALVPGIKYIGFLAPAVEASGRIQQSVVGVGAEVFPPQA